jgi:hypothetical protein
MHELHCFLNNFRKTGKQHMFSLQRLEGKMFGTKKVCKDRDIDVWENSPRYGSAKLSWPMNRLPQ